MIELRHFQTQLVTDCYSAWNSGAINVMPVAATGSGKTVVLSKLLLDEPGISAAIAHRQELVSQISIALARNGVRHRIIGAKKGSSLIRVVSALQVHELGYSFFDPNAKTGVGGVDTVIRMDATDPFFMQCRFVVQDEGHHVLKDNKWGRAAKMFPNARGLFPTATPLRADGKGLGRHADGLVDRMILAPSMREIIDMGYLTDYRIFAPPSDLDLSGVDISPTTGDYNQDQMRKAVRKSSIVGDVVQHYLRIAPGKLGVTFASDVEEATKIAMEFRAAGVPAEVVTSKTPDTLRVAILKRLLAREILQVVNVDLFGEGVDLPAVEVVSFARPTESFSLYCQQFGRGLRLKLSGQAEAIHARLNDAQRRAAIAASNKPVAYIIDHVNNVLRHGLPDALREWSLDRRERKGGTKSDAIPTRVCANPNAHGMGSVCAKTYERYYKTCPYCGFYPEPPKRSGPEFVDGDLYELDAETLEELRGERARIDGAAIIPWGATPEVRGAVLKRHEERRKGQETLRNAVAWWAGTEAAQGRGESESYRRFYFKFGIDVANAGTLGAREAGELAQRVYTELSKLGIDGTVNASAYFANSL